MILNHGILIITRKDLGECFKELPIDEIEYFHISKSIEPYNRADFVFFKDDDGMLRMLKNRYPIITAVQNKKQDIIW